MMAKQDNREKKNMRVSFCLWVVLCAGAMTFMLLFAANKTIVIADMSPEQSVSGSDAAGAAVWEKPLMVQRSPEVSGSFSIPLPKGLKAEGIVIENRYMSRELWVYLQCEDAEFFENNALTGDTEYIDQADMEIREGLLVLKLKMRQVLEYRSTMENSTLMIACRQPQEAYDCVVIIDPVGGGDKAGILGSELQEKDVALSVARLVQKKLALSNVRVYLTRTEDISLPEEARAALADEVGADVYIGIGAAEDEENPDSYGILCYYNEEYFIPGFGNVQLADIVTREVTLAASNRAVGLTAAESGDFLERVTVPAARLSVGYLTNPREQALLSQETYLEKLADGVLAALEKICKELNHQAE